MKADQVIGTWDEEAFQCFSLDGKKGESLRIGVTPLGFPCVPLVGTYMESYDPVIPTVILQTPFEPRKVPKVTKAMRNFSVSLLMTDSTGCR